MTRNSTPDDAPTEATTAADDPLTVETTAADDAPPRKTLSDPDVLRTRDDVEYLERERAFDAETFEWLRERYDAIAGVVQVGVTTDAGSVLLVKYGRNGQWAPPGGDVRPGDDWAAAARRGIEELTGVAVTVDVVERLERTEFRREGDPDGSFAADSCFVRASLAGDEPGFRASPEIPADFDHDYLGDGDDLSIAWFDGVPADVNPNHEAHVRIFLD